MATTLRETMVPRGAFNIYPARCYLELRKEGNRIWTRGTPMLDSGGSWESYFGTLYLLARQDSWKPTVTFRTKGMRYHHLENYFTDSNFTPDSSLREFQAKLVTDDGKTYYTDWYNIDTV